jgi:hypothetical protein
MQDIGSEVWGGRGGAGLDTGRWDGATRSCSKASIPLGNCSVSSAVSATVIGLVWLGCQSDSPLYDVLQCTQNLSNSIIWKVSITRRPQGNARGRRWSSWMVVTSTHIYSTPTCREQAGIGESGVFAFSGGVWPGGVSGSPTVVVGSDSVD